MKDTNRNIADSKGEYVVDDGGALGPHGTTKSMISNIGSSNFCIGIGSKMNPTSRPAYPHHDVVMTAKDGSWMLRDWTWEGVMVRIMSVDATGNPDVRVGLPVKTGNRQFDSVFVALKSLFDGIMDTIVEADGYYWMDATWGTPANRDIFSSTDANGTVDGLNCTNAIMLLDGFKCSCTVTFTMTIGSISKHLDTFVDTSHVEDRAHRRRRPSPSRRR